MLAVSTAQGGDDSAIVARKKSVTKLSSSGERLWITSCHHWACSSSDNPSYGPLIATADGGAVLLDAESRLVRLGADGTVEWSSVTHEPDGSCQRSLSSGRLAELPDGTLWVAGDIVQTCDQASQLSMLILRFDSSGRLTGTWTPRMLTDHASTMIYGLVVATDGSIIVTGNYSGTVDFSGGAGTELHGDGASHWFAMKLRPDFSVLRFAAYDHNFLSAWPSRYGGLLTFEYGSNVNEVEGINEGVDPYIMALDSNLVLEDWSVRMGDATSSLGASTVAGNMVVGVLGEDVPMPPPAVVFRLRY